MFRFCLMPKLVAARLLARQCLIFVRDERCSMVTLRCTRALSHNQVLMTLHVALTHRTAYHYDRVIGMAPQVIRLRPAPHCRTPILSYSLNLEPKLHFINWQQDPFANYCARVVLPEKTRPLRRHGRSRGRHGGDQSVRLLRRGERQGLAVRLRARAQAASSVPISSRCRPARCSRSFSPRSRPRRQSPSTSSPTSIAGCAPR